MLLYPMMMSYFDMKEAPGWKVVEHVLAYSGTQFHVLDALTEELKQIEPVFSMLVCPLSL